MTTKWIAALALLTAPACWAWRTVHAQAAYPSRPVKMICGFPAGTSADIMARIYAQKLGEKFGQQFVVENRLGASGNLAAEAVARSERRRLYAAARHGRQLDQRQRAQEPVARLRRRLRADRGGEQRAQRAGGERRQRHRVRAGADRRPASERKRHVLRLRRRRHRAPPVGRAVQHDDRSQAHPRALSRQHPGPGRPRRRPPARGVCAGADVGGVLQGPPRKGAGRHLGQALGAESRNCRRWPNRACRVSTPAIWYGLLAPKGTPAAILQVLADALVEAGNAADVQDPAVPQRRRAVLDHARQVWHVHPGRYREVAQSGGVCRDQGLIRPKHALSPAVRRGNGPKGANDA